MTEIEVRSIFRNYKIWVGRNLFGRLPGAFKNLGLTGKVMIVTQAKVARRYLRPVLSTLKKSHDVWVHQVADGEKAKSHQELLRLYQALVRNQFERRDLILALGGGVVGDLAGFAAASYLRGIPFVNVATTLLAQVDSAIGGKTGVNLPEGKNLVGAFYPPHLVVSDSEVLKSLPDGEIRSALGEVIKYGIIRDPKIFSILEKHPEKILNRNPAILEKLVAASARIKGGVVSRDEFEKKGERIILNLGHTFGHALEQVLGYKTLRHGEAVALGIICAAKLSRELGQLSPAKTIRMVHLIETLKLPVSLKPYRLSIPKMLLAMQRDKKRNAGRLRFVLPADIGRVLIRDDIAPNLAGKILLEMGGIRQ